MKTILVILLGIVVASCGGGGGGTAATTQTLSGTAAQGTAITNAIVTLKDRNGSKITVTTGTTDGKYTMDVTGKTPPFLLQVPAKNGGYLYSVATASGTANIHPFTDLIIRNWYKVQGSDVETDFGGTSALVKVPTATDINTIEAVIKSILSTNLASVGMTNANFNLLTSSFNADGTGFDKVLDNTNVAVSTAGAVTVTATDPTTGITGTMVSANLSTDLTAADTTRPGDPSGLSALPSSATSVVLVWNASTDNVGVAGYNIFRGTTKVGTSPYPVYSDTGLTSSTNYCYQVEAFDGAGNVSANKSSQACATTLAAADTIAPTPPTSLTATAASSSQIDLSWGASTDNEGVAGYAIYRGVTKIATVTATSYSDTGLSSGTLYSYTVKALDGALNYSAASNTASATTQAGIPAAPTGVSATAGDGQVTISWSAVSGATSYNIYWSTASGVSKAGGTKITGATSPHVQASLANGTAYYYVVTAVTAVNSSGESMESAQVAATPAATAGTGTYTAIGTYTGGNATAGVITLNWTSSDFRCDGPLVGTETFTVTTLTATTMILAYPDGWTRTWSRPSGTANNVVGTWTASRSTTGNSYTLTINADGTASMVGNIFSCSDPVYAEVFMLRFNNNPNVNGIPDYKYCVLSNIRDSSNVVPAISYASLIGTGMNNATAGMNSTTGYAYDSSKKEWWNNSGGCTPYVNGIPVPPESVFPLDYTIFIKYTDDSTLTLLRTVSSWSIAQ